jgi:hypothetical protein
MLRWTGRACVVGLSLAFAAAADAQKYPGATIPTGPQVPYSAPSPYSTPSPYSAPSPYATPYTAPVRPQATIPALPAAPAGQEADAAAARVAQSLPLDPATRDLRDRLPPNVPAVERALGLHPPTGPATDLRGGTPSPRDIVNALAPR